MRLSSFRIPPAVLVLLIFVSPLWAGTTGKVAGVVRDAQTGEALIGANVIIKGTNLGAATDLEGRYFILNVPPGTYTVTASSVGYTTVTYENVKVSVDLTTTLNFSLEQIAVQLKEEVISVAERPLVRKDVTSVEARVDADVIKNLPIQEVSEILSLQAGVTLGRGGEIHIRGGRASEVAYWVDGKSVSDLYDGSLSIPVESNAVQELQVVSGTFNAEYGNAMSGIVNIVTKDGGRNYAGNILMYVGDYLSNDDYIFYNIKDFSPVANRVIEASLSGPLPFIGDPVTFYFF